MVEFIYCQFPIKGSTSLIVTKCHSGNLLVPKVPSPLLLQNQKFSMVKIKSHVTIYPTQLIPSYHATRWNKNNPYTWESNQHSTRSLCQVVILVALLEILLGTHQPQISRDTSLSFPSLPRW